MAKKIIPKTIEIKIRSYIKFLQEDKLPIKKVVLFGSYAKGHAKATSDIDICVISPKFTDSFNALQYLWLKRRSKTDLDIEPIGLSPHDFEENTSLAREIRQTGIEIEL